MTRFLMTISMIAALVLGTIVPNAAFAAGDAAAGKVKFQTLCVSCHGESGKGDGPTGKALAAAGQPAPRDFTVGEFNIDTDKDGKTGTEIDIINVVSKGALVYGGSAMMAPVQGLSDQDLQNLVAYIYSLKE